MNNPITVSCIFSVLEKQIVFLTRRLMRVLAFQMLALNSLSVGFPDGVMLLIQQFFSKLPSYQCRIALSRMGLRVAEVVSALNLRALPTHRQGLFRFDGLWRATTTVDVASTPQSSTFHPSLLPRLAPPVRLHSPVDAVRAKSYSLVQVDLTFFQRFNHCCRANPQHSRWIADTTAVDCHVALFAV